MAVTLTAAELAAELDEDDAARAARLLAAVSAFVEQYAPDAPAALQNEAAIRLAGYLARGRTGTSVSESVGPMSVTYVTNHADMFRRSGAAAVLTRHRVRRGGIVG